MTTDILPCPFCGGKAERQEISAEFDAYNAGASYIECTRCCATSGLYYDRKENLFDDWNRRFTPTITCETCSGSGEIYHGIGGPDDPERCHACNGDGEISGSTQAKELRMLRERLGPRGLSAVMIDGRGHYVNEAVKAEIDRLRGDVPEDIVVLRSDRENLAKRIAELVTAAQDACDLLAERQYGNAARSPAHNARLRLEGVLPHLRTQPASPSQEADRG